MWRSAGMRLARVRHARWMPVFMTVAAAGFAGCGEGGGSNGAAATRGTTSKASADPAPRRQKIVIKAHANLQDVVDKGEVLSGSSLGGAAFCQGGRFSGGHDTAVIYKNFKNPKSILRIGLTPGKGGGRAGPRRPEGPPRPPG